MRRASAVCALLLLGVLLVVLNLHVVLTDRQKPTPPSGELPPRIPPASSSATTAAALPPPPMPPCLADGLLLNSGASTSVPAGRERYLIYAPQFGLSNQLVALRNAVAWAQLLNRTLVLPHLLAHGTVFPRAPFGLAFDAENARSAVRPLRIVEMDRFIELDLVPHGVIRLTTTNKWVAPLPPIPLWLRAG